MMGIDKLEKLQALYENGLQVSAGVDVKDVIASHIETSQALGKALLEIDHHEAEEKSNQRLSDEVVSLAYYLAKELGEHVDDADHESLTDTVQRLLASVPQLPDVVYLAWPDPEKVTFERRSKPAENPALGVAVFVTELEALRFANESDTHYRVTCAPFGMTINQARYDRNALLGPVDATEKKEPF